MSAEHLHIVPEKSLDNPWRGTGLPAGRIDVEGDVRDDAAAATALFARCPLTHETPMLDCSALAGVLNVASLSVKDERQRLGLGSFKALGAAHAIAKAAVAANAAAPETALQGVTYVCASAGNHGLSMAAGARAFGARAVVYLSEQVPQGFAERLQAKGAEVMRAGQNYEASMSAAAEAADANGWRLLSDSTWPGYADPALDVMEGYLIMGAECARQLSDGPTHVFLQAGVGGLAAAMALAVRDHWGDAPFITIVEPAYAPALLESIRAGKPAVTQGPGSNMGRLDCKEPSHLALAALARIADRFITIGDADCAAVVDWLATRGLPSTPSGAAGIAGLMSMAAEGQVPADARVLAILTEEA